MTWLGLLVLVPMLAGCVDLGEPKNNFEADCPSWTPSQSTSDNSLTFSDTFETTERTQDLGQGHLMFLDYPLDRIELSFHAEERNGKTIQRGVEFVNSTVTVTFKDDNGKALAAYDPLQGADTRKTAWVFESNELYLDFSLYVELASPSDTPNPRGITVIWTWEEDGQPETRSYGAAHYLARYWYRRCG